MNLEPNRTNYGIFKPRKIHEEAKMRSNILKRLNHYEGNTKLEFDAREAESNYDIQKDQISQREHLVENLSLYSTTLPSENKMDTYNLNKSKYKGFQNTGYANNEEIKIL